MASYKSNQYIQTTVVQLFYSRSSVDEIWKRWLVISSVYFDCLIILNVNQQSSDCQIEKDSKAREGQIEKKESNSEQFLVSRLTYRSSFSNIIAIAKWWSVADCWRKIREQSWNVNIER